MDADVPLLVPEINADHLKLVAEQQTRARMERADRDQSELLDHRDGDGAGSAEAVRDQAGDGDHDAGDFGRGISGRRIDGYSTRTWFRSSAAKKQKMEQETQKILGDFTGGRVEPLAAKVSATCNRVPVVDGHLMSRFGRV